MFEASIKRKRKRERENEGEENISIDTRHMPVVCRFGAALKSVCCHAWQWMLGLVVSLQSHETRLLLSTPSSVSDHTLPNSTLQRSRHLWARLTTSLLNLPIVAFNIAVELKYPEAGALSRTCSNFYGRLNIFLYRHNAHNHNGWGMWRDIELESEFVLVSTSL